MPKKEKTLIGAGNFVYFVVVLVLIPIFPEILEDRKQGFLEKLCKVHWLNIGSEDKRAEQ